MAIPGLPLEGTELKGKVALVTGGAKNIGRAISLAFASAGASVAVNTMSSRAEADSLVKEIRETGGAAEVFMADISNAAAVKEMGDAVLERFKRVDILVLNASQRREVRFVD